MFSPHQYGQIIISNIGVFLWLCSIGLSIYHYGFLEVFKTYLVPYLWWAVPYSYYCDIPNLM